MIKNTSKNNKRGSQKRGYAVLELLFYVSFFAVLSLAVISAMLSMSRSFRETALYAELSQSAGIMERVSREIRGAENIASISATALELDTSDGAGNDRTVEFVLAGDNIELWEDGALVGNLNAPDIALSALSFTEITTAAGKAVKISLALSHREDREARTLDFYNTVALRGSY